MIDCTTIHDDGTVVSLYSTPTSYSIEMYGPVDGILKPLFDPIISRRVENDKQS